MPVIGESQNPSLFLIRKNRLDGILLHKFHRKDGTFDGIDEDYAFLIVSYDESFVVRWTDYL